jgi:hypothetical protein
MDHGSDRHPVSKEKQRLVLMQENEAVVDLCQLKQYPLCDVLVLTCIKIKTGHREPGQSVRGESKCCAGG